MSKADTPKSKSDIDDLVRRAEKGDQSAMPALRKILNDPEVIDLIGGDLARRSQETLIDKFCGKQLLTKEALSRKLDLMRVELLGQNPTPLEKLVVERIVTSWLHLHHLEAIYSANTGMSIQLATHYHKSITSCQKRYLAAIKALAVIRKLAVPVLQVNIAKKQINVAGSCVTASDGKSSNMATSD